MKQKLHSRSVSLGLLIPTLLSAACSGEAGFEETGPDGIARIDQDIINGTTANANNSSFVLVEHRNIMGPTKTGTGHCTGTLLRNDAVLTARHCVTTDALIGGSVDSNATNYSLTMGNQTVGVSEVIANSTSKDTALLIADRFITMNGSNNGWWQPIYGGTNASLLNDTLYCYGYGLNTMTTGDGILRIAYIPVASTSNSSLTFEPNASGQIQWKGDSGGSCLFWAGAGFEVTGVMSGCSTQNNGTEVARCSAVGPQAYRSWALNNLYARAGGYVHTATSSNIAWNWTTIDQIDANNNPNALVHVTANWNPGAGPGAYHNKNVGVWYNSGAGRWAIYNQDRASMTAGVDFNVSVGGGYVHKASSSNIAGHTTILNNSALNNRPNAVFSVTPNWNPGGSGGTYNNHPVGVWYNTGTGRWAIYNQDFAAMPANAAFNIRIGSGSAHFVQRAVSSNSAGNSTFIDHPDLNGQPWARVFATSNWNPGGSGGTYNNHPVGVWYSTSSGRWAVFNQDGSAMPMGAAFNIMVRP